MAVYATFDDLRSIKEERFARGRSKSASAQRGTPTFLSHSSKDEELLPGVIEILENHGALPYVDRMDTSLPSKTSPETGRQLKQRIRECPRFVLFVTTNSQDSKWVPWELGLADALKNLPNVCLFPAAPDAWNQSWAGQEYLGIYDKVVWGKLDGFTHNVWMVLDEHSNTATELSAWLAR